MLHIFYPTAPATAYGQRPNVFMAKCSATAEGENWAYGPTLEIYKLVCTKQRQDFCCKCTILKEDCKCTSKSIVRIQKEISQGWMDILD